tara:strand:+ start:54 stop:251 length:198 start_codon:yes stop_codon:yes gene_type:complete
VSDRTPQQRIDDALDRVLRASGSRLSNYTMPSTLKAMRDEMRAIMGESYIAGSNDCHRAIKGDKK